MGRLVNRLQAIQNGRMTMSSGDQPHDDREQAAKVATDLVRITFDDPEAVVRLVITEGLGEKTIFHFDASGPTMQERPNVTVRQVGLKWEAMLTY